MFFTAALFALCLLGTARLHKASILYDRRNVVSTSQTGKEATIWFLGGKGSGVEIRGAGMDEKFCIF